MEKNLLSKAFIQLLKDEMQYRKNGNERYSLRSFARDMQLSPSRLSELINEKGTPSKRTVEGILKNLHFTPDQVKLFIKPPPQAESKSFKEGYHFLSREELRLVADWQHFAVLTTMRLDHFDGSANWLSERLGISLQMTIDSLARLQKIKVVHKHEDGTYSLLKEDVETTDNIPSQVIRESHKQILDLAKKSLDNCSVDQRDINSITMAIDIEKLPQAKKIIKKFRRDLCQLLESENKNAVYNLNIQLHPLTKEEQ